MTPIFKSDGWHLIGEGFDAGPFENLEAIEVFKTWLSEIQRSKVCQAASPQ